MTDALERAIEAAEQLPERQQDQLAELIEQKLADLRWEALFARPESESLLRKLAYEAVAEDNAGLTRESNQGW